MTDYLNHIISSSDTVLFAIDKLNQTSGSGLMTLLVVDKSRMVGTITDGDVRRAILRGIQLDSEVSEFMNRDFMFFRLNDITPQQILSVRKRNIKLIPVLDNEYHIVKVVDLVSNNSYLPIDAVLMAGGRGERLRPLTLDTPKPLLEIGDRAIIDYNVDNLTSSGIENINVTINYLGEQLEKHFAEPLSNGVEVKCVKEPEFLGTMGAVKFVKQWYNDTILVMNSDLFTNINLEDFFLHFKEHDADMSIAAVPYTVNIPYGIFEIDNTREIRGVKEKPSYYYYANAGIYLIKKEMLDQIPDNTFFNATDLMQKLIDSGKRVIRFPLSGYWIDIGKPEDFKKAQDLIHHLVKPEYKK